MMTKLQELMNSAATFAEWRGHKLAEWDVNGRTASAKCVNCNAGVSIVVNPLPNQIDVGGEAVAINCQKTDLHFLFDNNRPSVSR